jgi:hypothetical protein
MYTFFNNAVSGEMGKFHFAEFNYIKRTMTQNAEKVVKYYRSFPGQIYSDNFLIRLLQSMTIGYGMSPERFVSQASDAAMHLSMALRMTSAIYKGQLWNNGVFLHPDSNEIIIATDTKFDISDIETNWQDLQPVKYLHHELTDITFPLLFGKKSRYSGEVPDLGFTVIEVNVPMLALQYQQWRKATANQKEGEHQSIGQFVKSYPIVNAIHSFTDYAIFNRLKCKTYETPIPKSINPHPFPIMDMAPRVDACMGKVVEFLTKKRLNFKNMMETVPMLSQDSLWDVLHVPKVPQTRQIEWALDIARLSAIAWLLTIRESTNSTMDGQIINYMNLSLRSIKSDNTFRTVLGPLDALKVNQYIAEYIKPFI